MTDYFRSQISALNPVSYTAAWLQRINDMNVFPHLPPELSFVIFSFFDLKSLIAARGVCQQWRKLTGTSEISPTRRALFDLYLHLVSSPWFLQCRPWTLKHLRHFDRQEYVAALLDQHHYIPEEFRMWILEWPARAAFGCIWPGLPCVRTGISMVDGVPIRSGTHWLGDLPPKIYTMAWIVGDDEVVEMVPVPGLPISSSCAKTWLLLDERDELRGKVLISVDHMFAATETDEFAGVEFYENWIAYLKDEWQKMETAAAQLPRPTYSHEQDTLASTTLKSVSCSNDRDEWDILASTAPPKFLGDLWITQKLAGSRLIHNLP